MDKQNVVNTEVSRRGFLKGASAFGVGVVGITALGSLTACGGGGGGSSASAAEDFSASAKGMGDITVTITVQDGKITAATVDTSNETEGIGKELGADFETQIVANGAIDAVSGATITCDAVTKALEEAKTAAGI